MDTGSSVRKQDVHGSGIDRVEHVKIPRPRKGQLRQLFRIHHKRRYCRNSYIDYTGAQTDTSGGTAEGKKDNAVAGYAVGDIVEFIGTKHYTSANASSGKPCKAGKAKITQIYKSGKHQYHLVKVSGGGSTVYGWVDAQDISGGTSAQKIMAGSKVRVKAGAKTYSGGSLASFVYSRDHIVKELSGKRAVITYGGTVVAAVNVDDLTLI